MIEKEATDTALCNGLEKPIDELADGLVAANKKTPEGVILPASKVIRIYDGACS